MIPPRTLNGVKRPTLVMLAGLPGSGKTTLARELASVFRWTVLDKDIVNTVLLEVGLSQSEAGPLAYEILFRLAHDLVVQQRQSVILDTAGRQSRILEQATLTAQQGSAVLRVLRCVAPSRIRAERMMRRTSLPSQWVTDETTEEQEAQWYAHLPPDTLIISSDRPWNELLPGVVEFLQVGAASYQKAD